MCTRSRKRYGESLADFCLSASLLYASVLVSFTSISPCANERATHAPIALIWFEQGFLFAFRSPVNLNITRLEILTSGVRLESIYVKRTGYRWLSAVSSASSSMNHFVLPFTCHVKEHSISIESSRDFSIFSDNEVVTGRKRDISIVRFEQNLPKANAPAQNE